MQTLITTRKTGPAPVIFGQVYEKIRDRVHALLEKKETSPLPSEMHLCSEYGCSRVTIRRVLSSLEKEGLIQRLPGKGTFPFSPQSEGEPHDSQPRVVWQLDFDFFKLESSNQYSRELITPIRAFANREGENVSIYVHANETLPLDPKKYTVWARRIQADAVITQIASVTQEELVLCSKAGPPVVLWGCQSRFPELDSVSVDYACDLERAIDLLYSLGHRKIAYIGFEGYSEAPLSRWQAYETTMTNHGLEILTVPCSRYYVYKDFYEYALSILTRTDRRPTALIAGGGAFSWPCLQALSASGLKIPQEISFLSMDEFEQASHYCPAISVVRQPMAQLVEQAVQIARQRVWKPKDPAHHILLNSEIVLRFSVAKPSGE